MEDVEKVLVRQRPPHEESNGQMQSLVVVEFSPDAKTAAMEWFIAKIQAPRTSGGADLLLRTIYNQHNKETVLYLSASTERLLLAAEVMGIKKRYVDGYLHEFCLKDVEHFQGADNLDSFLTTAEKQRIISHELENIRATENDEHIPGYEKHKLYCGKSIVKKYQSRGIILQIYPLHEEETLKRLGDVWYKKAFSAQPLHDIRDYFGEQVSLYFAFLGFYTIALIPPSAIGIIYLLTSWENVLREAIFAIFNLIWVTVILEAWKRYCSELSYRWGTINTEEEIEEPRANFHGSLKVNEITGKEEPYYPTWKRHVRFYGATVPFLAFCLLIAFWVMLCYFWMQDWADNRYSEVKGMINYTLLFLPTAIYAIIIGVMNGIYRNIAWKLNNWENHRLQSAYDNHLILKLVLFDFMNCFMSLFYVAFFMQDMTLLRSHLAALLITQQVIGQLKEAVVPYIFFQRRAKQLTKIIEKFNTLKKHEPEKAGVQDINLDTQKQANIEGTMDVYEGPLDDYLEMFLQFGYVFLFSSVFPLAAVCALINNVTEVRSDSFKMCRNFQRPFAIPACSIGAWQLGFECLSVLAVMTNCALIALNPEIQKILPTDITPVNMVLIFVAVEHIILGIKAAMAYSIPDRPKWVEIELSKMAYQSKQALQKERMSSVAKKREDLKIFASSILSRKKTEL